MRLCFFGSKTADTGDGTGSAAAVKKEFHINNYAVFTLFLHSVFERLNTEKIRRLRVLYFQHSLIYHQHKQRKIYF